MLDLNRANLSIEPVNIAINDAIERAARPQLSCRGPIWARALWGTNACAGFNSIGGASPCSRRACARSSPAGTISRRNLVIDWSRPASSSRRPRCCGFSAVNGALRGNADGIIIAGPDLPGAYLIYPLLWEHKAVNSKNWRALERDGLEKTFPQYAAQVALYQAYLDITNPALFTALNADTCERLHFLVPFNAERAQLWSDRAVTIIEATRAGELLPRGFDDPKDWHCRMCGHHKRCWGQA